jgi:spore coat polysaccharide biosynthesis protein SpsF
MKAVIIVQARMTSTRLPGKVLKQVLEKPLLEYQIERLLRVKLANEVVIATTTNTTDEPIVELCDRLSISYFRGSEFDVLARYHGTAKTYQADVVVRVTSDCPLIDPLVIDQTLEFYHGHQSEYDYVSNCLRRTYPRGMDTEVFPFAVLSQVFQEATASSDREHVTSFIYRHPNRFRLGQLTALQDYSQHRWTVDTVEDFELIRHMLSELYPKLPTFTFKDCLKLIERHPDWMAINAHIEQTQYCS